MKQEYKDILTKERPALVENISIDGLITQLLALKVLDQRKATVIKSTKGRHAQVEDLLDTLLMRPDGDFDLFCKALRLDNQGHLVDEHLKPFSSQPKEGSTKATADSATSQQDDSVMSEEHQEQIREHSENIIQYMQPEPVIRRLWARKVLTKGNKEAIDALKTNTEKNEKIMDILSCKPDKAYQEFIEALKKSEQTHIAKYLK